MNARIFSACRTLALMLCLAAGQAEAADSGGALRITHAWSRPTPPGATTGVVYLSITNGSGVADRLLALSTPVAAHAELHETRVVDGLMQMRPMAAVDCPPNATVHIEPGSVHIMLTGLRGPLLQGSAFPLEMSFARAGTVTVQVRVGEAQ